MWTRLSIFDPPADSGFVQGSAINGRICADLHVVLDYQPSDLRGLLVTPRLRVANIAEAIAAENGSSLHDDAVAESCARVDRNVGVDTAMASDRHCSAYVVAYYRSGADGSFVADADVFAEDRTRADSYVVADLSGRRKNDGWMNAAPGWSAA